MGTILEIKTEICYNLTGIETTGRVKSPVICML